MSINTPAKQTSHIKREILVRLIRAYLGENFEEDVRMIPFDMRPKGSEVPYRCCIHKERAILRDRVIAGLGFDMEEVPDYEDLSSVAQKATKRQQPEEHPLTLLQTACNECVPARIHVTDLCQGCVARPCESACRFGAIKVENGKSHIDQSKCKNCGLCVQACPFQAITKIIVPCENACPVGAEFEEALKKIDSKVNRWKNWAQNRNKPKGEAFNEANETEEIQTGTDSEKAGDPVICVYMELKIGDDILPIGHYQVKGEMENGKPVLNLYQAHYLMAKIPAVETKDDFGEKEILFAGFIPENEDRVKIIYGSLDFNAYAFVDTIHP